MVSFFDVVDETSYTFLQFAPFRSSQAALSDGILVCKNRSVQVLVEKLTQAV